MFSKKGLFVPAVLVFVSFLGASAAIAEHKKGSEPDGCYTVESLQGNWACVNNFGDHVAIGLQPEVFDGDGNLTRTGILNRPDPNSTTGARIIATVTSTGTYTVNCDGTGQFSRDVYQNGIVVGSALDDFIITAATRSSRGRLIATTIIDAQQAPSLILPGGVFLTRVHTRLPD